MPVQFELNQAKTVESANEKDGKKHKELKTVHASHKPTVFSSLSSCKCLSLSLVPTLTPLIKAD